MYEKQEEWFKSIESEWSKSSQGPDGPLFSTFGDFERFIVTEQNFWNEFTNGELNQFRANGIAMLRAINEARKENISVDEFLRNVREILAILKNVHFRLSHSREGQFLAQLYKVHPNQANAAYSVLVGKTLPPFHNNVDTFVGVIRAIVFVIDQHALDDLKLHGTALEDLASKFQSLAHTLTNNYHGTRETEIAKMDAARTELREVAGAAEKMNVQRQSDFVEAMNTWEHSIRQLQTQFGELMRLKKPADYWNQLVKSYLWQGAIWISLASLASIVFVIFMSTLLQDFPTWLKGEGWSMDHLKGAIIFAIIVSISTYVITLFVRLGMSAFHLSRDAKERYQLTYVYLSMISEKAIDPDKDRQIVLQSLFSRADTGLLKGDGGPTMPNIQGVVEAVRK